MKTTTIDIYSDLICPWCYIGKRRMEAGLKLMGKDFHPEIVWRPFQLNPDMPFEGMNRKVYRSKKFGSWERSMTMDAQVVEVGKSVGLEFNFDKALVTPNTLAGHRLLWWAEKKDHQDRLAEGLFHAYFTEGRDVGKHDVLTEVAAEVGLPKNEALAFLDSDAGTKEVAEESLKGLKLGLEGVPFIVINGQSAVSGAQTAQNFFDAFEKASDQQAGRISR
jgi:predicted DsbA family dithiol-disulfide isomerase